MHRPILALVASTLLVALTAGCDSLTGNDRRSPAAITAITPTLTGVVGRELDAPVLVRVTDAAGRGLGDRKISFRTLMGHGSLSPQTVQTDGDGLAQVRWKLGTVAWDAQVVEALVAEAPGLSARVQAVALPEAPAQITRVAGDGQEGIVGQPLEAKLTVQVRDRYGNLVPDASVAWAVTAGGGTVDPRVTATDAKGRAATQLTLGPLAELNSVAATVGDLLPVTFNVRGRVGSAARLSIAAGDQQVGSLGGPLPDSVVVQVTDKFGNPVAGEPLHWAVRAGGGVVSPSFGLTDAHGFARARWTLGMELGSDQVLDASTASFLSVSVKARAVVQGRATLTKLSDNQSAPVGRPLAEPISVVLRLDDGRPVRGATVTWTVSGGGGQVSPGTSETDAEGRASARWTLGPRPGTNSASASVVGVAPVTFSATAQPGAAAALSKVSGDQQFGTAGMELPTLLTVRTADRFGNPVSGAMVTWSVLEGGGSIALASAVTDASGTASARWKLGTTVGTHRLGVAVAGVKEEVVFTARGGLPSTSLITKSFDNQTGAPGDTLAERIAVVVRYFDGRPAIGVPVTWTVDSGGGEITSSNPSVTDEDGVARARWKLGPAPGTNTAAATVLGIPPVTFTATGKAPGS